jgi:hypothetical protein
MCPLFIEHELSAQAVGGTFDVAAYQEPHSPLVLTLPQLA